MPDLEDDPLMTEEDVPDVGYAGDSGALGAPAPVAPPIPAQAPDQWWIPKPPKDNSIDYDERNRREAVQDLFRRVPLEQATKAIEAATRLEGMLGFDADRKAGIPVMEALQKWSPKLYFNHPAAIASLARQGGAHGQPFVPTSTSVDGQKLIQMSPNRYSFPPNAGGDFQPREVDVNGNKLIQTGPRSFRAVPPPRDRAAEMTKRVQDDNLKGQIKALERAAGEPMSKARKAEVQSQIDTLRRQRERLVAPKAVQSDAMKAHREEAAQLIQQYPAKADAIKKRFAEEYGEPL